MSTNRSNSRGKQGNTGDAEVPRPPRSSSIPSQPQTPVGTPSSKKQKREIDSRSPVITPGRRNTLKSNVSSRPGTNPSSPIILPPRLSANKSLKNTPNILKDNSSSPYNTPSKTPKNIHHETELLLPPENNMDISSGSRQLEHNVMNKAEQSLVPLSVSSLPKDLILKSGQSIQVPNRLSEAQQLVQIDESDDDKVTDSGIDSSDLEEILQGQRSTADVLKARQNRKRNRMHSGTEKRAKKRRAGHVVIPMDLPPEVKEMEKKANELFVSGKYQEVLPILEQMVSEAPKYAAPYHLLSSIHADLGNNDKSLGYGILAASLCPSDPATWLRIGKIYIENEPRLAVACLKRAAHLREDEDSLIHLALAYEEIEKYEEAVKMGWVRAFELRRIQGKRLDEIAQPLAKTYYRLERWEDARKCLEECLVGQQPNDEIHVKTVFFLSDVLLGPLRMFRACADMIMKDLQLDEAASKLPLPNPTVLKKIFKQRVLPEILKNLAVSLIMLGKYEEGVENSTTKIFRGTPEAESLICVESMFAVFDQPYDACGDSICEVMDAMLQMNHINECYVILNRFRQDPNFADFPPDLSVRFGKVAFRREKYSEALSFLAPILEDVAEAALTKTDEHNLRIMVAECYFKLGNLDACSRTLLPMSFEELSSAQNLPPAMSSEKRRQYFIDLCTNLKENNFPHDFIPKFTHLVHDCELDITRVEQLRADEIPLMANHAVRTAFIPEQSARRKIGLSSIETMYSTEVWFEFVRRGALVLGQLGKLQVGVEMLEAVIAGRRELKKTVIVSRYLPRLMNTSMALSLEAGITKVAFKYVRQHIMKREGAIDERLVALFTRLLVASAVAYDPRQWRTYSNSSLSTSHRPTAAAAFSDYYKWAVRLLLAYPKCFTLMLLIGHLCVLSGQYRTACEEYERAYRIIPLHPMPPLCCAVSQISVAMSRMTPNRHAWIAQAKVNMHLYKKLRLAEGDEYLKAEVLYNEARLYHQLNIVRPAVEKYRETLKILETLPDRVDINTLRRVTTFNLAIIIRKSENFKEARRLICTIVI